MLEARGTGANLFKLGHVLKYTQYILWDNMCYIELGNGHLITNVCHVSQSSDGLCPSMEKPYKKVAEKLWSPILLDLYSGTRFLIIGGQRNTHNIFLYNMWHIKLVMSASV